MRPFCQKPVGWLLLLIALLVLVDAMRSPVH